MTDNAVVTDLDARYGRRPPMARRRRTALALAGVAAGVLAVVAFYFWWAADQDPFTARVRSYQVVSDARVDVSVEVVNNGHDPVRCEIVVQDKHTLAVGTAVVQTGPGPGAEVLQAQVPTTTRAMTVDVHDCTAVTGGLP